MRVPLSKAVMRIKNVICIKYFKWYLVNSKHSISIDYFQLPFKTHSTLLSWMTSDWIHYLAIEAPLFLMLISLSAAPCHPYGQRPYSSPEDGETRAQGTDCKELNVLFSRQEQAFTFYAVDFDDKIVCFLLQPYCYISTPGGVIREWMCKEERQKYVHQIISRSSITLSTLKKKVVNGGRMTYSSS